MVAEGRATTRVAPTGDGGCVAVGVKCWLREEEWAPASARAREGLGARVVIFFGCGGTGDHKGRPYGGLWRRGGLDMGREWVPAFAGTRIGRGKGEDGFLYPPPRARAFVRRNKRVGQVDNENNSRKFM